MATSAATYRANRTATQRALLAGPVRADAAAVALLLLLTLLVTWRRLGDGDGLYYLDTVTAFLPWFDHLGDRLRAGDLPGWNAASFSGTPFAGDPESGWMYLPAMLLFPILPPLTAMKTLVFAQLALAALATYALGRVLGLGVLGGLVAALANEFGQLANYAGCCPVYLQTATWIPVGWLGVELAFRAERWSARLGWWALAGFAASQQLAAWVGQGALYGLLALAAFVGYRGLFSSSARCRPFPARVAHTLMHGGAVLAIALGLAAAGLLPRLDFLSRSTRAGGISLGSGYEGWSLAKMFEAMLTLANAGRWHIGAAVIALAVLAPLVGRGRVPVVFLSLYSLAVVVLVLRQTPLHDALFEVPLFFDLHRNTPNRVLILLGIGPALLAGATVDGLADRARARWLLPAALLPLGVLLIMASVAADRGASASDLGLWAAVAVVAVLASFAILAGSSERLRPGVAAALHPVAGLLLAGIVFWSLTAHLFTTRSTEGGTQAEVNAALAGGSEPRAAGAAAFLQERQRMIPVRYFGFDPWLIRNPNRGPQLGYRHGYQTPSARELLVANRSVPLGLEDIQGYNPVQLARYAQYMDALNRGVEQEYHETNVLPSGLSSPLLDLIGAGFVVVPAAIPPGRPDLLHAGQHLPTVYRDGEVRVLENGGALPRAWIVHQVRQAGAAEILAQLATGAVDPRHTALIEERPPAVAPSADASAETVAIERREPDRVKARATAASAGMLVFADVYDEGWRAYVDGEPARLYRVDYLLRGVAIPAGPHAVELRYEPASIRVGLAITLLTATTVAAGWLLLRRRERRADHLAFTVRE